MKKLTARRTLQCAIIAASVIAAPQAMAANPNSERDSGRGAGGPVIYVTSQGLYYDSIVLTDLPPNGRFQQLVAGMYGLETEYGPGTPGHLGGRWWMDTNDDGMMDDGDLYFLCPLLGPGRTEP